MDDVDLLLEDLARFAEHPPAVAPPVEAIARRATRRRSVRRATALAVLAVVLVPAVALGFDQMSSDDTELQTSTDDTSPIDVPSPGPAALRIEPSTGLRDGQEVIVTLPEGSPDFVVQCASEAVDASDPVPWCDLNGRSEPIDSDPQQFRVTVRRAIQTTRGLIDCAEQPGRCIIGIRTPEQDFTAPISFRGDLGPIPTPTVAIEGDSSVGDGGHVTVRGTGFVPGDQVIVTQCRVNTVEGGTEGCDGAREARVTADEEGAFSLDLLVYHEIFGDFDGWYPCQPCVVRAGASGRSATAAVQVNPGSPSRRATVEILPASPYQPGQLVQLRGTGFQANVSDLDIGWCRFHTDDPATEPQGAGPDYANCAYPSTGVRTDGNGEFVIDGFSLPAGPFGPAGETCEDPSARCGLAWHPTEGSHPVFITFFELGT